MRLIRYADDFVVMVAGGRDDAEALRDEVAMVLAPMGLRLSAEKTRVCHIDEGFDFLGWRIQRRSWRGRAGKRAVYTYPSKKALASVMGKVRSFTRREKHRTLADLLHRLNPVLRGGAPISAMGCPRGRSASRSLRLLADRGWLRKRHPKVNWGTLHRRFLPGWEAGTAPRPDPYTYVPTWSGFLYVAVVVDDWSRRVVGWAMADHLRTTLILDAIDMAIGRSRPGLGIVHHSDRGTRYTSLAFGRRCQEAGIAQSMA